MPQRAVPLAYTLILAASPAHSLEVSVIETDFEDGSYRVELQAMLDAPADAVAAVLTDFAHYRDLDPRISESEVLATTDNGEVLLRTRVQYSAEFEPDFWVPPFIGRRYALKVLRDATLRLFANVEDRARHL